MTKNQKQILICEECLKKYERPKWRIRGKHNFCSEECDKVWKRKKRYKDGGRIPY